MSWNGSDSRMASALLAVSPIILFLFAVEGAPLQAHLYSFQASDARFREGVELLTNKKYDEAARAFQEARLLNPSNTLAITGSAEVLMAQGKPSGSRCALGRDAADKAPSRLDLRKALGQLAMRVGNYDLAVATSQGLLGEAILDDKARAAAYLLLGETYRRKGDAKSAIASLQHAEMFSPDDISIRTTLAMVLESDGQHEDAEWEYRAALGLNPRNSIALNNLAYLLAERGDLDEAMPLALQAWGISPDINDIGDTVGWDLSQERYDQRSVGNVRGARAQEPDEFVRSLSPGPNAFWRRTIHSRALQQFRIALDCKPAEPEGREIRKAMAAIAQ